MKEGDLAVSDIKLYYKAMVIKTIWLRDRREDQWNRLGVSDLSKTGYDKPRAQLLGQKSTVWQKLLGKLENNMGEIRLRSTSHTQTKINSEWMNDLNIKKETVSKLGEHRIEYLSALWERKESKTKQELEKNYKM